MDKKMLDLLYRSFDAVLTFREQRLLDQALQNSVKLRKEKQLLEKMRSQMATAGSSKFRPFFAERVLSQIKARQAPTPVTDTLFESLVVMVKPMVLAAIIVLISLLFFNLKATDNFSVAGALGQEPEKLEQVIDPVYLMEME